jgi:signal transduction histidine kinase
METRTMDGSGRAEPDVDGRERSDASMARLEAHEQERARLAEELHDGPAQALASAIFQTELVERALRADPAAAAAEVTRLRQMLQRELETLRAYISQMRPQLHEPEALEQALQDAATTLTEYTGIPVDVRLEAAGAELEVTARNVVLRVAQEALRNIGKHSGAQRAWVSTRLIGQDGHGLWELEVGDDGRGMGDRTADEGQRRRHFGLRFMRERSDLLGAQLSIEPGPAAVGTVVRLRIDTSGRGVEQHGD